MSNGRVRTGEQERELVVAYLLMHYAMMTTDAVENAEILRYMAELIAAGCHESDGL